MAVQVAIMQHSTAGLTEPLQPDSAGSARANGLAASLDWRSSLYSIPANSSYNLSSIRPAATASMSGFPKPEPLADREYAGTRPIDASVYLPYASATASDPHIPSTSAGPMGRLAAVSENAQSQMLLRSLPEQPSYGSEAVSTLAVNSWEPQEGPEGSPLTIYLTSDREIDATWSFYVNIGSCSCPAQCTRLGANGPFLQFALEIDIPPLPASELANPKVNVELVIQDATKHDMARRHVGAFRYTDVNLVPADPEASNALSRKRKISSESAAFTGNRSKRLLTHLGRGVDDDGSDASSYMYMTPTATAYTPQSAELPTDTSMSTMLSYGRTGLPSPRRPLQHHFHTMPTSQPRGYSPLTSAWASMTRSSSHSGETPELASLAARAAYSSSPHAPGHPMLMRTSTMPHSPSIPTPGLTTPTAFNPYAMYSANKAALKINGDLDSMTTGWTEDELKAKRRLVQFTRSQRGSVICTDFEPVTPEDHLPHSICISCIFWESRNEYYVTSVDTIYLLESLVAVRFTVEEKNRIRRNLEGFRPQTVSKGKSDSEDFFKLIMGFPNPKPRNIEKDVKVFNWTILAHALKKIIGKYVRPINPLMSTFALTLPQSASYSSAAGPVSAGGSDIVLAESPMSTPESAMSAAYSNALSGSTVSAAGPATDPLVTPYTTGALTNSLLSTTTQVPASSYASYSSYYAPSLPLASSGLMAAPPTAHESQRPPPWDLSAFMEAPTSVPSGHDLYALEAAAAAAAAATAAGAGTHDTMGYPPTSRATSSA